MCCGKYLANTSSKFGLMSVNVVELQPFVCYLRSNDCDGYLESD